MNLAELFVALKIVAGESERRYEAHKSSFAFQFVIKIKDNNKEYEYLLVVSDFRGGPEYTFYKVVSKKNKLDRTLQHEPFKEFLQEDIKRFMNYFYNYILGVFRIGKLFYDEPFIHKIESQRALFGYLDNQFFAVAYDIDSEQLIEIFEQKQKEVEKEKCLKEGFPNKSQLTQVKLDVPLEYSYLSYFDQMEVKSQLIEVIKNYLSSHYSGFSETVRPEKKRMKQLDSQRKNKTISKSSPKTSKKELLKTIVEAMTEVSPEVGETFKTAAERLINNGNNIEGQIGGEINILTKQLRKRFGNIPKWAEEKLKKAKTQTLESWGLNVLDSQTLEEALR